jgi:hypothetical protein
MSTAPSLELKSKNDDCPLCRKYRQGPCGGDFVAYFACRDKYPMDKEPEQCEELAKAWGNCLEKYAAEYESIDPYTEDSENENHQDLRKLWDEYIMDMESSLVATQFPSPPQVQVRLSNLTGMVSFEYSVLGKDILLGYVRDEQTQELIGAGSSEDLWEYQGYGILRLSFLPSCKSVCVYALYTDEHDNHVLYKHRFLLPQS